MTVVLGYLAAGLSLHVFLHTFYDWMPGFSRTQKFVFFLVTVLIWPYVLAVLLLDATM